MRKTSVAQSTSTLPTGCRKNRTRYALRGTFTRTFFLASFLASERVATHFDFRIRLALPVWV